jgi:hypothetical protein
MLEQHSQSLKQKEHHCLFLEFFFLFLFAPFRFFGLVFYCLFSFFQFGFLSPFFFTLVLPLFFDSCGFISSLAQLAWD